jgi:Neuraminidase (sialidase)
MEVGVGLTSGQGSDPQLMLKYSKDGGKTWSNEKWRSIGGKGEYSKTIRFDNFGTYRQIMFKAEISDPVKVSFISAYADIEVDDSY